MFKIGIDVGSTYTKFCIMDDDKIISLFTEKTPVRQKEYFTERINKLRMKYKNAIIVSCGYGKNNIDSMKVINELVALAKGANYLSSEYKVILDIGGQDTKIITQENGVLKDFFINDRCAAGSGMFLQNICNLLNYDFSSIDLTDGDEPLIKISSLCAVFAQSEITQLLANNISEIDILKAVIWQTLTKSKYLTNKVRFNRILLSGGFTKIKGIDNYCKKVLNCDFIIDEKSSYISAIGCCI